MKEIPPCEIYKVSSSTQDSNLYFVPKDNRTWKKKRKKENSDIHITVPFLGFSDVTLTKTGVLERAEASISNGLNQSVL